MGEIVQPVTRDPDPDRAFKDVLFDVVERNKFNRKLVRYDVQKDLITLVYQTPD